MRIKPQPGPQEKFLACTADIAIYGGAAGGGKTFSLLMDGGRWLETKNFTGVIFRRTYPQIVLPGGLWDTSVDIFGKLGFRERPGDLEWINEAKNARLKFAQMQHAKNARDWQGSQMAYVGFDELTHFLAEQFWYMISRNRTMSGIRPYIRGTCNPDPDSWVKGFIGWWLDEKTGLPIPERDGVIRWMAREAGELLWADSADELIKLGHDPKSVTFIAANVSDNQILLKSDPSYVASLKAMVSHERERLLGGNWNARPTPGTYFRRAWFEVVDTPPATDAVVRYWDRASTEPHEGNTDPDWTVGVRMSVHNGVYYVEHVERLRGSPEKVENTIKRIASQEPDVEIRLAHDPGQAGDADITYLIKSLAGYSVRGVRETKAKEVRARPVSSQCEAGNVKIVRGRWNEAFFDELEGFPAPKNTGHDDQVDGFSGAFNELTSRANPGMREL